MRKLLVEVAVLVVISAVVAFSGNALRDEGRIHIARNYFDRGDALVAGRAFPAQSTVEVTTKRPAADDPELSQEPTRPAIALSIESADARFEVAGSDGGNAADIAAPAAQPEPPAARLVASASLSASDDERPRKFSNLQHSYQEIDYDGVKAIVDDPMTRAGLNVLVDARDDDHYSEGRIAGAVHCFPHEVERYADKIRDAVQNAERVVVYCSGGDCEDSIFMCRELLNMNVPYENVFLYPGGWKEWVARGGPVEGGEGSR